MLYMAWKQAPTANPTAFSLLLVKHGSSRYGELCFERSCKLPVPGDTLDASVLGAWAAAGIARHSTVGCHQSLSPPAVRHALPNTRRSQLRLRPPAGEPPSRSTPTRSWRSAVTRPAASGALPPSSACPCAMRTATEGRRGTGGSGACGDSEGSSKGA